MERPDDAVETGINRTDFVGVLAGCFDHATGRSVDDRSNAARLGVEGIFYAHGFSRKWLEIRLRSIAYLYFFFMKSRPIFSLPV